MKFTELTFLKVLPQKGFVGCNQSKKLNMRPLEALVIKGFLANFTFLREWAKKPLSKPIVRFCPFRELANIYLAEFSVPLDLTSLFERKFCHQCARYPISIKTRSRKISRMENC